MIRVLLYLVIVFALALGLGWLAENPGTVTVSWMGRDYGMSVAIAAAVLLAVVIAILVVLTLLRGLLRSPKVVGDYFAARRRDRGYRALSRGMLAVGAGDAKAASRNALEAERLLSNEPLTLLLKAQAAQLNRDLPGARAAFEQMLPRPETKLLALHGLYVEAQRQNEPEAARHYAEEAVRIEPAIGWAGNAVLDYQAGAGQWNEALRTLASNRRARLIEGDRANRMQSVLETAEAMELESGQPEEARTLALAAHRRSPELVPAAVLAARLSSRLGDVRRAARIVEKSWRIEPHPDLAAAYKNIRPGDSVRDRLRRMRRLAGLRPEHREGRLALAEAAIEARALDEARQALAPDMAAPSERVCLLMADLAEAENNEGAARDWLGRAIRAPRDAVWMADGVVHDRWAPISPMTGRIDAFEWKVPEERPSRTLSAFDLRARPLGITKAEEPPSAQAELDLRPAEEMAAPPKESPAPPAADKSVEIKPEPERAVPKPVEMPRQPDDPGISEDVEAAPRRF
jgi:HemY protein